MNGAMKDRTIERGQGCWNCIHGDPAGKFWAERRLATLKRAVEIVNENPLLGENHPKVINIRRMIPEIDKAVMVGAVVHCTKGRTATGQQVGDLTPHNYLCDVWTGRQGASVARLGGGPEKLPEELMQTMDYGKPKSVTEFVESQKEPK